MMSVAIICLMQCDEVIKSLVGLEIDLRKLPLKMYSFTKRCALAHY